MSSNPHNLFVDKADAVKSKYKPSAATLDFFIWRYTYLPLHENKTPITHYKMIDYYFAADSDDISMVQCHRGLGKSQLSMEFSLYCICEGIEQYVLLVGGTQDLTNDLVASAAAILEEADITGVSVRRSVEGILEINSKSGDVGYLVAKSTGSKLRGVAKGSKRHRPSLIVLDDIVSDDLVLNRLRMDRANRWFTSALLPTLKPGGKTIGSGTPMNQADPFMTLCNNFGSFKIPLSNSSFPDRFNADWIAKKKGQYEKLGQLRDWKREFELVLTDEETQLFDMSKVRFVEEMPDDVVCFLSCDLAFSEKEAADYSALVVNGVDRQGRWYIYPVRGRWKPSETATQIFTLVDRFEIINVGIEQGSSYIAVKEHLDKQMLDTQTYFNIIELKHGGKSKISRISTLEPVINSNRLHVIDNGDAAEALTEELELCDSFACNAAHDDLCDALAYQTMMNLNMAVNTESHHFSETVDEDNWCQPLR